MEGKSKIHEKFGSTGADSQQAERVRQPNIMLEAAKGSSQ
jgi:hypothetical protein